MERDRKREITRMGRGEGRLVAPGRICRSRSDGSNGHGIRRAVVCVCVRRPVRHVRGCALRRRRNPHWRHGAVLAQAVRRMMAPWLNWIGSTKGRLGPTDFAAIAPSIKGSDGRDAESRQGEGNTRAEANAWASDREACPEQQARSFRVGLQDTADSDLRALGRPGPG